MIIDELKHKIQELEREKTKLLETNLSLLNEIKHLKNDNTYLDNYSQRLKQIVISNDLISYNEMKEMRKARHSR